MAGTWIWTAQGDDIVIAANYWLGFCGATFDSTIPVGSYQDSTHVYDDGDADECTSNHTNNVKWISSTEFDNGGGTETMNPTNLTTAEATFNIHYDCDGAASYAIQNCELIACYSEGALTTNPEHMSVQAAEAGTDSAWTLIDTENSTPLTLSAKTAAVHHTWYVAMSVKPTAAGEQSTNAIMYCSLEYY